MNDMLVLDTQSWIWFLEGNSKLSVAAQQAIADPGALLIIPAIVLAEACWMSQKKRTSLTLAELRTAVDIDPRLKIEPLQEEMIFNAAGISALVEIHDCLIIGTALYLSAGGTTLSLVTADRAIQTLLAQSPFMPGSGIIKVLW